MKEAQVYTLKDITLKTQEKLRIWAVNFIVCNTIINALLKILNDILPDLPKCSKTLLKTNSGNSFLVEKFFPEDPSDKSEYVYVGLSKNLKRIVNPKNHEKKNFKTTI